MIDRTKMENAVFAESIIPIIIIFLRVNKFRISQFLTCPKYTYIAFRGYYCTSTF